METLNSFKKYKKIEKYLIKNRAKIYMLIIVYILLELLLILPYVNLYINRYINFYIFFLFFVFIFRINWQKILTFALFCFVVLLFLILLHRDEEVIQVGNFIYLVLAVTTIISIKEIRNKN